MTNDSTEQDAALMAAFAEARAATPAPEADFLARVLADGHAVQDDIAAAAAAAAAPAPASRGWRGVFDALGGWPAVTGLGAAAVSGLWIGVAAPEALSSMALGVTEGDILLAFEPDLGIELFPAEEE